MCLGSWDRAFFEGDRVCLAGIVTSILDEDRVSSGTAVSLYLCHDANIHHARGPSGGHAQRFFISHRFDLQPLLLRRNRKEAHDAVSTMFLSCVRQDLICHRLFWDIPGLRIADTEQGLHADDGTRCCCCVSMGSWKGSGPGPEQVRQAMRPGLRRKFPLPPAFVFSVGTRIHRPGRLGSWRRKVCQTGTRYAMIGPVHRPPFPRWLSNQVPPGFCCFQGAKLSSLKARRVGDTKGIK